MKITGFHKKRDFHENVGFAERRASKTPINGYVYKGFWRRRRGKLDFRGKHRNPGNPAKIAKNAEILEFHQKREKTENRGNGKTADSWKSEAPSPAPLPGRSY